MVLLFNCYKQVQHLMNMNYVYRVMKGCQETVVPQLCQA